MGNEKRWRTIVVPEELAQLLEEQRTRFQEFLDTAPVDQIGWLPPGANLDPIPMWVVIAKNHHAVDERRRNK